MITTRLWSANDQKFILLEVQYRDGDPWVRYQNQRTNEEYTCRQEAFLDRFRPLPD